MTYFFDINGVVHHLRRVRRYSGIQRVVVNLIVRAAARLGADAVYLTYLDQTTGRYRAVPFRSIDPDDLMDPDRLRALLGLGGARRGVHPLLRGYADRPGKYWFHWAMFEAHALAGNERHFRRRNTTLAAWKAQRKPDSSPRVRPDGVSFDSLAKAGDQLLLLDGTWTVSRAAEVFRAAKTRGLTTFSLIHDLIPVEAHELVPGTKPLTFHDWLLQSADHTSVYLAVSQATRADLARFLAIYGMAHDIRVVPLAQAAVQGAGAARLAEPLRAVIDAQAYPRLYEAAAMDESIRGIVAMPYALCVGTMEVRKNIWRIAQAWDRLRQVPGLPLPRLVFAGLKGWMAQDFDRMMAATGGLGGWITVVEGSSDAELEFLYRNCDFTIMASLAEGWGLPVGESLSYGKTAVVSQTTALPEVGGDMVEYCDPLSIDSIAAACTRLIADPDRRRMLEARIAATRLRTWDDVADDLVAAIRLGA